MTVTTSCKLTQVLSYLLLHSSLSEISNNPGCTSGSKFVLKGSAGVRKQFVVVNGKPTMGFVLKGKKFPECEAYTDITPNVKCKEVTGLAEVSLERKVKKKGSNKHGPKTDSRVVNRGNDCDYIR